MNFMEKWAAKEENSHFGLKTVSKFEVEYRPLKQKFLITAKVLQNYIRVGK